MQKENPICQNCFLASKCSPGLKPEWMTIRGKIYAEKFPPVKEVCRHSTCDEGLDEARAMMRKPAKVYEVNWEGENKRINAVPFGTLSKPTKEAELRIVEKTTGAIFSKQDGIFYFTGQVATLWY